MQERATELRGPSSGKHRRVFSLKPLIALVVLVVVFAGIFFIGLRNSSELSLSIQNVTNQATLGSRRQGPRMFGLLRLIETGCTVGFSNPMRELPKRRSFIFTAMVET